VQGGAKRCKKRRDAVLKSAENCGAVHRDEERSDAQHTTRARERALHRRKRAQATRCANKHGHKRGDFACARKGKTCTHTGQGAPGLRLHRVHVAAKKQAAQHARRRARGVVHVLNHELWACGTHTTTPATTHATQQARAQVGGYGTHARTCAKGPGRVSRSCLLSVNCATTQARAALAAGMWARGGRG
jgi:hypothetical protein